MASGGAEPLEKEWQRIEEQITCSICGDLFTDPEIIPCLHTFCKQCIERNIKASCPLCPRLCRARLPQGGTSVSRTNFSIKRLVEIFGKRKEASKGLTPKEIRCGSCEDMSKTAVMWCIECENSFCGTCNDAHKTLKAVFKSHKTVAIEEFIKNPKVVLSTPEKAENCKIHSDQPLDLYCNTCNSLTCRDCTLSCKSNAHDCDFIYNVIDEEREIVRQTIIPLKHSLERVRNGIKRIEEGDKEIDIETEANRRKIQGAYSEAYKLLKQQEEEALEKVDTIKTSLKKKLAMQKQNAQFMESQLVDCEGFSDDAISVNRTRQLLTCKDAIIDRVEDLMKQVEHTSVNPECGADDMIVLCSNPDEFINDSLCDVSGIPHLPYCSVRGPLENSNPVKVTITLKDVNGFSVVQQSKDVEIHCNKDEEFLQNIEKQEESGGVYHIWYNPKRKEHHLLSVYWRGLVLNDEEVKVPGNIRDYANIKQVVKVIDDYGPNSKQLQQPFLIAKGPNNEIIVRNNSTNHLVVFDEQLQYLHVIGGSGNGDGMFNNITGITVDRKGYLFVADSYLHCIQKFTLNGKFVKQFGNEGATEGQFKDPYGLAFSQPELLFVCDSGNQRIQVFKNELFFYVFGMKEHDSFRPCDLTLNNNEDLLFVTDTDNNSIQVFTPSGLFIRTFGYFTDVPIKLQHPIGIYYTLDNHLLISSKKNNCLLVFEEDGRYVSAIEGKERFSVPCGVIMMNSGHIVIASYGTHKLVMF